MKVLIIGGYGTFGGRLARLLGDEGGLTIVIAGRDGAAAERFCRNLEGGATKVPAVVDRTNPEAALAQIRPDLVIDTSGPFQNYGDDPYRLVRASFAVGADYIDLADGADFVAGIGALDEEAKVLGRFALSGMSSFPVLTAAVVRVLVKDLGQVKTIRAGIAPSPFAGVGLNVIKAIASYAGKPVEVLADGRWQKRPGFVDSCRMTVNIPGEVPLWPIRFALAEVPDLKVLPGEWPGLETMWMGAGPTPASLHRLLWLAGSLVRIGVLPSLLPLAPLMNWAVNWIRWGEHRGGMIVDVSDGKEQHRSWHLLAEGEGGPMIPSMAAQAVVLRCIKGLKFEPGARPGHRDLELIDYQPLLQRFGIKTGFRRNDTGVIYADALGGAFQRFGPALRAFHDGTASEAWEGRASVTRGSGWSRNLVARLFGFPDTAKDVPVKVCVERSAAGETWIRNFAGRRFQSQHSRGRGHFEGLVTEQFGPIRFGLAVIEREGRLGLQVRGWSIFGLRLPRWLMPWSSAWESDVGGQFNFDVEICLPWLGSIVRYRGWLARAA